MSNVGKWDGWYGGVTLPEPYGEATTYYEAEKHLKGLSVEDWGCGKGFFRTIHSGGYLGVDGSNTPYTDVIADLTKYTSNAEGILLRHVIEHNSDWESILSNAVSSTDKLVLVLFTPMSRKTKQIAWNDIGVPDISFKHGDIVDIIGKCRWETFYTDTIYKTERLYWKV